MVLLYRGALHSLSARQPKGNQMLRTYDVHQRDEGITLSLSHITNQSFAATRVR